MLSIVRGSLHALRSAGSLPRAYATHAGGQGNKLSRDFARETAIFKTYKPVTPGLRHLRRPLSPHLYEGPPVRLLTVAKRKKGGRNNQGVITVRHRGGGHRQRIRLVDFHRNEPGEHDVVRIEYDPGRSAHIALVRSRDANSEGTKKWSYILAPDGTRAGDVVQSFRQGIPQGFIPGFDTFPDMLAKGSSDSAGSAAAAEDDSNSTHSLALGLLRTLTLKTGNVLPLRLIPPGTLIHNISLKQSGPGILVRSAGSFGQVVAHEESGKYCQVRLQSGEVRKILQECCATIGKVSNLLWKHRSLGKAGRSRWLGRRPSVRGVAMNAYVSLVFHLFVAYLCRRNDHPHGGGRGKSKSNKHPVSIWGWGTKGTRTRKPGPKGPKNSNKMVVRERPRGKDKKKSK